MSEIELNFRDRWILQYLLNCCLANFDDIKCEEITREDIEMLIRKI